METLSSGSASFTPHLALISFASEADDPTGVHAIHELAHALTFAQSDFYAEFAAKRLTGQKIQIGPFAPLLETVPEALGRLGERHAPGTRPKEELVVALVNCVRDYVRIFAPAWAAERSILHSGRRGGISRDIPSAKVVFYDTGHFALETHAEEISDQIRSFLTGLVEGGKF